MRLRTLSLAAAAAALIATAAGTGAQERAGEGLALELRPFAEFRPIVGGYLPIGPQRRALSEGGILGAQLAFELHRSVHLVGSALYVVSRVARGDGDYDDARMLQYDVGAELNTRLGTKRDWTPKPFVGGGVGRRSYRNLTREVGRGYRSVYGAAGIEYQTEVIGIRLETRGYVSRFAGYDGSEPRGVRHDLMVTVGIAYHIR